MTGSLARRTRTAALGTLALLTGFGALAVTAAPASGAGTTRHVTTGGTNTGDCTGSPCLTVQYAVDQAIAGDTIEIAKGEYQESVQISKSLTLHGVGSRGSDQTVIDGNHDGGVSITVDGTNANQTVAVTIKDVAVDGNPDDDGIELDGDATLDLVDSSSSSNSGIGVNVVLNRGLAAAKSTPSSVVTVSGSDVSNNDEGGIEVPGASVAIDHSTVNGNHDVGLIFAGATAEVDTSTFDANRGAGIALEGGGTTLNLRTSTLSNNEPFEGKGSPFGAGVLSEGGTVNIANSTLAGNTGNGLLNEGGQATVSNSTVSGTHAATTGPAQGGLTTVNPPRLGIDSALRTRFGPGGTRGVNRAPAAPAAISVVGSIVAEQDSAVPDCVGTITDGGDNLSSDAANSCKFTSAKHDQVKTDPVLGPLANNTGPTKTELLKKLSPAIDAVPAGRANCATSGADQRGVALPQPTGGKCDIGAVELAASQLAIHPDSLPNGKVAKAYHAKITATGGQYPIYTFAFVSGTLPDGLTMNSHGKLSGTPTKAGTFHFRVSVNDPAFKNYTIVITDAAPNGGGTEPVSNTGAPVVALATVGAGTILAGMLLMIGAGLVGRRPGRHRTQN